MTTTDPVPRYNFGGYNQTGVNRGGMGNDNKKW